MFSPEFLTVIATAVALTMGITQTVKKWLKLQGIGAVILSLIVSALVCLVQVLKAGPFDVVTYIVLTIVVFATANGWYNIPKEFK